MPLIDWKDEYSVGVPGVDHEHRQLIDGLNRLHGEMQAGTAGKAEVGRFLNGIYGQIAAHFAYEEKVMADAGYLGRHRHKADHERLLDGIRVIMDDHARGAYDAADERLARHLNDWFVVHFKTEDAKLYQALRG